MRWRCSSSIAVWTHLPMLTTPIAKDWKLRRTCGSNIGLLGNFINCPQLARSSTPTIEMLNESSNPTKRNINQPGMSVNPNNYEDSRTEPLRFGLYFHCTISSCKQLRNCLFDVQANTKKQNNCSGPRKLHFHRQPKSTGLNRKGSGS